MSTGLSPLHCMASHGSRRLRAVCNSCKKACNLMPAQLRCGKKPQPDCRASAADCAAGLQSGKKQHLTAQLDCRAVKKQQLTAYCRAVSTFH